MNQNQLQAYRSLVEELLNCPSGEELDILRANLNLVHADLVVVMQEVGAEMITRGRQSDAYWLQSFAAILLSFPV